MAAWPRSDPVAEIDRLVTQHRADQRAWQHQLEDAGIAEQQALGAMQAAQDMQVRARAAIDLDVSEIDRLLTERTIYVPLPRIAEDG